MSLQKSSQPIRLGTYTVRLTFQQRNQLLKFLDRAQLSGAEVPAFATLHNLITSAAPDEQPAAAITQQGT